ncbi:MAG: AI-2E family transporter [Acidobacteria bacterium]|jgi:predicted PurR-regulated permease PerM|nr:AI-2E family transporter [Acidobacteriota bacterium]
MADGSQRGAGLLKAAIASIAAILAVVVLRELRAIFIPFCIALFLYFMLNEIVRKLQGWKIPKTLIMIGVLVGIFVALYLCGLLLFSGASSFIDHFPLYSEKISRLVRGVLANLKLPLIDVRQYMAGIDWDNIFNPAQITALVSGTMGTFTSFIGNLLLVLLLLMFMLGERVPMVARIARTLSARKASEFQVLVAAIEDRIRHYLFIKTLMSVATAALAALILLIGRVDFIIFSALLIFLLNFIPTFGSLLGTIFPVLITFLRYGFCLRLVLVCASLMVMQFVTGNVVEPMIMGRRMNLSPIIILLSLIFWGWLWGVVGMFLAVPVTSAIKIVLESIPALVPVAAAMGSD